MSNNFYDLGLQDAEKGKCLSETAIQFLGHEENLKSYLQGYSAFAINLSKEAQAKMDAESHLLNHIDDILGLNVNDETDKQEPRDYVYGDTFKSVRYIALSSSTGLRIEYDSDGTTFDDIEDVFIVKYGFTHVEVKLDQDRIDKLHDSGVF